MHTFYKQEKYSRVSLMCSCIISNMIHSVATNFNLNLKQLALHDKRLELVQLYYKHIGCSIHHLWQV